MSDIRGAALKLGYIDARPVTGHPFGVWRNRLKKIPLGQHFADFPYEPAKISGWPLEEITVWVAVAATPPVAEWPEGCGEIAAHYMRFGEQAKRRVAWEEASAALGYEIIPEVLLPERAAAIRAGLGVHGLNGLLITPEHGSFVNITVLLARAAPPDNARGPDYDLSPGCGNCGACIPACPTGAVTMEGGVDTAKCLRGYINHPEYLPEEDYPKMGRRIQGCDTCQQACPKNRRLEFDKPSADIIDCMKLEKLLTAPGIDRMLETTKIWYTTADMVKRQAVLAAANTGRSDLLPLIEAYIGSEDQALDKMARWAARQL
jgi:ferredoxin